jgi:hypothetical protein
MAEPSADGSVRLVNTLVVVALLVLPTHVGQEQFGRFPFVGDDEVFGGGGTSWGVVLPDVDNGGWGRVCEEAYGRAVFFAVQQPGRLLLGGLDGLSTTTDDGCSYQLVDNALAGSYASALWLDPHDARHLLVGTSTVSADNGIWESQDGGDTFAPVLARRPGAFFHLAVSDDGARLAASGSDPAGHTLMLLSNDAGASFVDVSDAVAAYPIAHALLFDGDALVVGGINSASEGVVDHLAFDGVTATLTHLGTVPRETTHAVRFLGQLYVLSRNGARGELYVENGSTLGFGLVQGGPSDCLAVRGDALFGCGKQVGLNTALFLRSDDGVTWSEVVPFRDVHYRVCPEDTAGYAECGNYLETACNDGVDNEVDGYLDCDDDDCAFNPACRAGEGEGEGEGDAGEGEGEGDDDGDAAASCCTGSPATAAWLAPLFALRLRRRRG